MGCLYRPGFYPHRDIVGKIKSFFVQPLQHFYTSKCKYVMQVHTNRGTLTHASYILTQLFLSLRVIF